MGTPAAAAPKAASPPKAAQTPLPDKRAPPEMLHITVQSANDLLPAAGKDTCDAFCTVRAEPLEKRNGRRTAIKHSTRDPEWQQSFVIPFSPAITSLEFKVWHSERLGSSFLGVATAPVPASATADVTLSLPLVGKDKHAKRLSAMAAKAGTTTQTLGTLHVHMWRAAAQPGAVASASRPRRFLGRVGSGASAGGGAAVAAVKAVHLASGCPPAPFDFVHVDVMRARALLPMDRVPGREPSSWTSDPYVTAQLVPTAHDAELVKTSVKPATLYPQWNEELVLHKVPRANAVRLVLYDKDKMGGDDVLGEVMIPLPASPEDDPAARGKLVQGWFPLAAPSAERGALVEALRAIGRGDDAEALERAKRGGGAGEGLLGQVYVRVCWGAGVRAADVNKRPALRTPLGTLRVRVHEARGLPARYADRPLVRVRCEHATGVTPAVLGTRDPVFPPDASEFTFTVTEVTGDVVFTVVDVDPNPLIGDQVAGEVCVPLQQLLAPALADVPAALMGRTARARAGEDWTATVPVRWAELLPPRLPGEAMMRMRPQQTIGALCFSASLELDVTGFFAYMAPDVLPLEAPPGRDASMDFTMAAMNVSLGRMLDGIFLPIFAPLRTLLYLRSWQAPRLNGALIGALTFFTLFAWRTFLLLAPLWLMLWPVLHGYVSYLIHAEDYLPLNAEDEELERTARNADAAARSKRDNMLWEAKARALVAAREAADPEAAAAAAAAGVGAVGSMTSTLGSMVNTLGSATGVNAFFDMAGSAANETAAALSAYRRIMDKLKLAHEYGAYYGDMLEQYQNLFTWRDKVLSGVVAVGFAALGLALSVAFAAAVTAGGAVGLGINHAALAIGLSCFYPTPDGLRYFLEATDYYLSYIPITLTSQCAGSGLDATIPAERRALQSEAALRDKVEAEAAAAAAAAVAAEEAERVRQSTVRRATLTLSEFAGMGWLGRLIERAPTLPRDTHANIAVAARRAAAKRPPRSVQGVGASSPTPQQQRSLSASPSFGSDGGDAGAVSSRSAALMAAAADVTPPPSPGDAPRSETSSPGSETKRRGWGLGRSYSVPAQQQQ